MVPETKEACSLIIVLMGEGEVQVFTQLPWKLESSRKSCYYCVCIGIQTSNYPALAAPGLGRGKHSVPVCDPLTPLWMVVTVKYGWEACLPAPCPLILQQKADL